MKHGYICVLFLALIACNSQPEKKQKEKESIDPKVLISCDGVGEVKLTDAHADLKTKFGAKAISEHENTLAGKFTTIWENDPKHLNIFWKEQTPPFKTIRYIEIVNPMAPYMTKDSIGIGVSLRDLVSKNGNMAITFKNFTATEEPGVIKSFGNGEIPKVNPCFAGVLEWADQRPIDINELREFQAMQEVKSFEQILHRMDIILATIRVEAKGK